jgi:hypothetical protein
MGRKNNRIKGALDKWSSNSTGWDEMFGGLAAELPRISDLYKRHGLDITGG